MRSTIQLAFFVAILGGVFLVGGNAERWCPFGGAEAIYTYVYEGNLPCSLAVSNFFILGGVFLSVLLLRRAFCGYACPIGAVSEWMQRFGAWLGFRRWRVPRPLDAALSMLKYVVLILVLVLTWRGGELILRGYDPCYALLSKHGEDITYMAYVVSGALIVGSFFVTIPFCRWLCPLGALLNPLSKLGLYRVKRSDGACTGCQKCTRICPMAIPVHEQEEVTQARCTSCLQCLDACPKAGAGALAYGPKSLQPARRPRVVVVGGLLLLIAISVAGAYLFPLPSFRWSRGEAATRTASIDVGLEALGCRGKANLLVYFLTRDDDLELSGAIGLEAWPQPEGAYARISFDPTQVDADSVKAALSEPYFEDHTGNWRHSPFRVDGHDPFAVPEDDADADTR